MMQSTTLVLGGGGLWGIAWMTGLIAGLAEQGVDVREARTMIGTSAGSVMATQLRAGTSIEELFLRQVEPARQTREQQPPAPGLEPLMRIWQTPWDSMQAKVRATCELALRTPTIDAQERRSDMAIRLGASAKMWPAQQLEITAVDVDSGELRVFDAASGAELLDAVCASCAVPGVWPIVPIQGRRYIDGGAWTPDNAHLAQGAPAVLIVSPFGGIGGVVASTPLGQDIAALRASGSRVSLICADAEALASAALGPLNPATREPAARAGRAQAGRVGAQLLQALMGR